jgi:hypothetical protein
VPIGNIFVHKVPRLIYHLDIDRHGVISGKGVLKVFLQTQSRNFMDKGFIWILLFITKLTVKNAVSCDMMSLCSSCKNRRFGGPLRLHLQGEIFCVRLVCSEDVPHGGRGTDQPRHHIRGDSNLHYYCLENTKTYTLTVACALYLVSRGRTQTADHIVCRPWNGSQTHA